MPSDGAKRTSPAGRSRLHLSLLGTATHSDLPARSTLRRWVHRALNVDAQVTLVFVGARAGRRLNRQFRRRDYATNVLTFGYQTRPIVVADIVICLPIVRREARQQGKTLREHLAHMVVHGALHALGHDHARRRDAQKMQLLERRLLAQLRIPDPYA